MLLITFDTIPQELITRDHPIALVVGLGLFLSFILIALAKLVQSDIYIRLTVSFLKNKALNSYLRESFPVQKLGSILLLANYWVSFSLMLLLLFNIQADFLESTTLIIVTLPLLVLFYNVISFYSIGLFSGETGLVQTPILMKVNGAQFLGIGCSVLVFLLSMHFIDEQLFLSLALGLLIFENSLRLLRSLVHVFVQGVSWYYIIMYFCTLEILPLFITFYVLLVD